MKKYLLDTNVYEHIIRYLEEDEVQKLAGSRELLLYGNEVIRKELREIGAAKKIAVNHRLRNMRVLLLSLYDALTGRHSLPITGDMAALAGKYFIAYKTSGGGRRKDDVMNDFLIVACASVKCVNIVVSEDFKTMLSGNALAAYKLVNNLEKVRTPGFVSFEKFRRGLRGVELD